MRPPGWITTLLIAWAGGLGFADWATAHTRSQSFSSWYIQENQVRLSFSVQALEATRLGILEDALVDLNALLVTHLTPRISVHADGEGCRTLTGPLARAAREGYLRVEWRFECPAAGPLEMRNDAFFDVAPSHIHYARVRTGSGPPVEYLFTNTARRQVITAAGPGEAETQGASFAAYLLLGIVHIVVGVDHIAFLLALLLLCRHVREVLLMVTGFTVGHSVTLSLAILNVVEPNVPVIEALIGFTIALVAAENVCIQTVANRKVAVTAGAALAALALLKLCGGRGLPVMALVGLALFTICYLSLADTPARATRLRPLLTVLFGLIHGFGFASVLMEIGLPTGRLVPALLGFNLGVEIGQLGIVAVLWLVGSFVARRFASPDYRLTMDTASAALCALGVFWFIERAFMV